MTQRSLFDLDGSRSSGLRNQVIEAGAGTGKTTRIVSDVVRYLLEDESHDPARLVLMTFTEKAAGEIAARVRAALIEIRDRLEAGRATWPSESSPILQFHPDDVPRRLRAARVQCERLEALQSQTIHSFCQMLLRAWPLDAGVDPSFRIIEGFEQRQLLSDACETWLHEELRDDSPYLAEWSDALAYAYTLERLRGHLVSLIPRRGLLEDRSWSLGSLEELVGAMNERFDHLASIDDRSVSGRKNGEMAVQLLGFARRARRSPSTDAEWDALVEQIRVFDAALTLTDFPKEYRPSWDWIRTVGDRDLVARHRSAAAYRELAIRFFTAVDAAKAREGVLDFDDLLEAAARLVRRDDRVQEVRKRFDAFFVDEFQDTDRVQALIIDRLVRDSSGTLGEGRITLVGDPKQSIYSFRRAEPEVFHDTMERYQREGAALDVLTTQYRSDPALVTAINAMFTALLGHGQHLGPVRQPGYVPLNAGRSASAPESRPRLRFIAAELDEGESSARAEAEAVAQWISQTRVKEDHSPDGDLRRFAILLRKKKTFAIWADVFERRGIDLEMPPSDELLSQRGSIDLIPVLQAIADPSDRAARFSAARSVFFAIPDDRIAASMLSRDSASDEWREMDVSISRWREIALARGVGETIDAILADRRTGVTLRLIRGGERWLSRIEHLRRRAAEFDMNGRGGLSAFVRELGHRREEGTEIEPPPPDEGRNAVRLMTVHAAKGLEFGTVILAELGAQVQRGGIDAFTVPQTGDLVMSAPTSINRYLSNVDGVALDELQKQRANWERDRLFYVAVTRAKHEVIFSTTVRSASAAAAGVKNPALQEFWSPISTIFGFGPADLDTHIPDSYEEDVSNVTIAEVDVAVGFERIAPRRVAESPVRFEPGVDVRSLTVNDDRTVAEPPARIDTVVVSRRLAAAKRRSFGIAIHRLLELWNGTTALDMGLERTARELRLDQSGRERLRVELDRIERSKGWQLIRAMKIIARELPIVVPGDTIRELRLDLLVEDAEGRAIVVDYKTGEWSAERAAADSGQVSLYCSAVTRLAGRPCSGLIWYTGSDRLVEVSSSGAAVPE